LSGHSAWLLFVAVWAAIGGAHIVWRGYFDIPLYGRIERSRDPISLWIFAGFAWFLSAILAFAAFA